MRWNNTANTWEYFSASSAGSGVIMFNGRSGSVAPAANDYTWAQIDKTTSSLANLTTRSATDLNSGTLADARLSGNVPLRTVANVYAVGNQQINIDVATNKGQIIKGFTAQTAVLSEWQNAGGSTLYAVNASGTPTNTWDLVHKLYVDNTTATAVSGMFKADGSVAMTGNLNMGSSQKITNLATPTVGTDGANKSYVDSVFGNAMITLTSNGTVTITGPVTSPTIGVRYGTTAGLALQGNQTFAGDVSGTSQAIVVTKLQGRTVNSAAPTNGQLLTYNGTDWIPANISIPTSSIGTAEISDGTVQSTDITDGTIVDADISGSAAIAITKVSGYGDMCLQNQGNVTITGGRANLGTLTITGSSGDVLDVAAAGGGGMRLASIAAGAYIDLQDATTKTGSVEMDGNGVFKIHNKTSGGGMMLGAGGGMTTVLLWPNQNKIDFGGAYLTSAGNPTTAGDVVTQMSDIMAENQPILFWVNAGQLQVKASRVGFLPIIKYPSQEVWRPNPAPSIAMSNLSGWRYIYAVRTTSGNYIVESATQPTLNPTAAGLLGGGIEYRYLGAVRQLGGINSMQKFIQNGNHFTMPGTLTLTTATGSFAATLGHIPWTAKLVDVDLNVSVASGTPVCTATITAIGDVTFPSFSINATRWVAGSIATGAAGRATIPANINLPTDVSVAISNPNNCTSSTYTQKVIGYTDDYL